MLSLQTVLPIRSAWRHKRRRIKVQVGRCKAVLLRLRLERRLGAEAVRRLRVLRVAAQLAFDQLRIFVVVMVEVAVLTLGFVIVGIAVSFQALKRKFSTGWGVA